MPTIPVLNKCNNNCIMCTNPDNFQESDRWFSLRALTNRIERFYKGGNEFLDNNRDTFSITGGEPTLSPHLPALIRKINHLFPKARVVCLTNARMFAYQDYAKIFLQSDANLEIAVSLYGHKEILHDAIARTPGSFRQTLEGIKNICRIKKPNHLVEIRIIIHKLNYKLLKEIARFVKKELYGIERIVYIFFEIEGQAQKNIKMLKLTYSQLAPYINEIYDVATSLPETRFYHFPLCVLPQKFYPYIFRTLPLHEVSFLKSCNSCKLKDFCMGIHKGYLAHVGSSEFNPIIIGPEITKSSNWYHPIMAVNIK